MDTELALYDYWRILCRRKAAAMLIFLSSLSGMLLYTWRQPKIYKSQAIIKIRPPASYSKVPGARASEFDPSASVPAEVITINSNEVSSRVAQRPGIRTGADGQSPVAPRYKAERVDKSDLISVTAEGETPPEARDTVNAVIKIYRNYDLEQKSAQLRKILHAIASRKAAAQRNLLALELQKKAFLKAHPDVGQEKAMISRLIDLEARKRELKERYTEEHPEIAALRREIKEVETALRKIPAPETDLIRISRELRTQEDIFTTLNAQHEETKLELSSVRSFVDEITLPELPAKPSSPGTTTILLAGMILGAFLSVTIVLLSENLNVSLSNIAELETFLGLPVLGIIPRICGRKPAGAWIPNLFMTAERRRIYELRKALIANHSSPPGTIEAYHALRASALLCRETEGKSSFVFSSAGVAEGKTLTAANFALSSAASSHKTLLIDADMRRPSLHGVFVLKTNLGLSDVIAGKAPWRSVVTGCADLRPGNDLFNELMCFSGMENLKLLGSGTAPGSVPEIIRSANWHELIEDFKMDFDTIIFDTPPILLFSDPVVISRHTDGVILVYRAGKLARCALKRAREQVVRNNSRVLGVALNDMRESELSPPYSCYG